MNSILAMLRTLYYGKKIYFILALFVFILFIAGCSSEGSAPSGPIGGGC